MAGAHADAAELGRGPSPGETSLVAALGEDGRVLLVGLGIAAMLLAGMFVGSRYLMLGGAGAAFLLSLVNPMIGLVVLAAMGPLKPPPAIPAPGFNLLLVGAVALGCVYRLPFETRPLRVRAPVLLLLGFVVYVFVQQLPDLLGGYAGERAHDVGYMFFQVAAGLGAVLAAGFLLRERSPYPVLVAGIASALFAVALALATAEGATGRLANLVPAADIAARATGPFGNPNSFGQFLAYAVVLAAAWLVTARSARVRLALVAVGAVLGLALTLSLSRGAVATVLVGLVVLAFSRRRAYGVAAAASAIGLVLIAYPLFVQWRLSSEVGTASAAAQAALQASDAARLGAILAGPALFGMSPVFGIGFGQYRFMSGLVTDTGGGLVAHNWYGTVLAEEGLLGLGMWLLLLLTVAMWLRSRPAQPRSVGNAMLGAFAVGCLFLSPPTSLQTAVLPALTLTAALVASWDQRPPDGAPARRPRGRASFDDT